jgi:hypothetical protein
LLRGLHADARHLAWNSPIAANAPISLRLSSSVFEAGGAIPRRHAGRPIGDNVSPALSFSGVPAHAAELVLIVEDVDAPIPRPFVHAIASAIPNDASGIAEDHLSDPIGARNDGFRLGKNSFGKTLYAGPRPIPGHGPHTYVFQLFALDRRLSFTSPPRKRALLAQMDGAVIARAKLDGSYER